MDNIRNLREYLEAHLKVVNSELNEEQRKNKSLSQKLTNKDGRARLEGFIDI